MLGQAQVPGLVLAPGLGQVPGRVRVPGLVLAPGLGQVPGRVRVPGRVLVPGLAQALGQVRVRVPAEAGEEEEDRHRQAARFARPASSLPGPADFRSGSRDHSHPGKIWRGENAVDCWRSGPSPLGCDLSPC